MGVERHDRPVAEALADDEVGGGDHAVRLHQRSGTLCRSTVKPRPSSNSAARAAWGSQSPGGFADLHLHQFGEEGFLPAMLACEEVVNGVGRCCHLVSRFWRKAASIGPVQRLKRRRKSTRTSTARPASADVMHCGVVADAALAAHEEHADGAERHHGQAVVTRAARANAAAARPARRPRLRAPRRSRASRRPPALRRRGARSPSRPCCGDRLERLFERGHAGDAHGVHRTRQSSRKRPTDGITFTAPGWNFSRPTVATRSGVDRAWRSTSSTISAAAAPASWRSIIGTVPAWPATPFTFTTARLAPLMAVTMPTGRSWLSSTGPCSICTST